MNGALLELTLLADQNSAEPLADALLAAGALSVSVEDADAESPDEAPLFGEPGLEPQRAAWARSRLRVLWEGERATADTAIATAALAAGIAAPAVDSCAPVADADWVRASQAQFPSTKIGDRLWIVPSWHKAPADAAIVVRLDPGVAFGTGTHATTQLCLAWLCEQLPAGASVLDYGCGSGILAIAAGRLGAGRVVGVDLDPQAVAAARANSVSNEVAARYTEPAGLGPGLFDVVVANILSNPLKLLAPALLARVAGRGALVLSGVLERQADEVIAAYCAANPSFDWRVWRVLDGWACLAGRRTT
jgi:ribosomal protein L11 methyltransferase